MPRDYNHPDPELPDEGIEATTKLILELYANEIREHASGILSIYGLSGTATAKYKNLCFQAANSLHEAAEILRQNAKFGPIQMMMAPASPEKTSTLKVPSQTLTNSKKFVANILLPVVVALGTMAAFKFLVQ